MIDPKVLNAFRQEAHRAGKDGQATTLAITVRHDGYVNCLICEDSSLEYPKNHYIAVGLLTELYAEILNHFGKELTDDVLRKAKELFCECLDDAVKAMKQRKQVKPS